jgi:hypothetical protein
VNGSAARSSTVPRFARQRAGNADTSLRDEIAHRIVSEGGEGAHDIVVTVADGIATLEGPVPERVTKEMLEAIVEAVPGVRGVDNRLCVDWVDGTPSAERVDMAPPRTAEGLRQLDARLAAVGDEADGIRLQKRPAEAGGPTVRAAAPARGCASARPRPSSTARRHRSS